MPEGVERPELIRRYAVDTGLTLKKSEEHLDLLEDNGFVEWNDLRLYTTSEGMRWAGYKRDHSGNLVNKSEQAEEAYRARAHANAQKAAPENATRDNTSDIAQKPTKVGNTLVTLGTHPNKSVEAHARTVEETSSEGR
jgi:hypothetical protein